MRILKKLNSFLIKKILFFHLMLLAIPSILISQNTGITCGFVPVEEDLTSARLCGQSITPFLTSHVNDIVPDGELTLRYHINVIFVQDENGDGNFKTGNQDHETFWEEVINRFDDKLANILQTNCNNCTQSPTNYQKLNIKIIPNYIEVKSATLWDHWQNPVSFNAANNTYLTNIDNLAKQSPNWKEGFNWVITTGGQERLWVEQQGNNVYDIASPNQWNTYEPYQGSFYSMFPSFNLANRVASMHMPNVYTLYLNSILHNQPYAEAIPGYAGWIAGQGAHELGHYFGLRHECFNESTRDCTCSYGDCQSNIMRKEQCGTNYQSFSGCQIREIFESLIFKDCRRFVECDNVLDHEIIVDTDEIWAHNMRLYSNIRIKTGVTLKVLCDLHMQADAKIIVEQGARFILDDGATISNGSNCNDGDHFQRWGGIKLAGNNNIPHKSSYNSESYVLQPEDHGIVLLYNGSTFADAKIGIECVSGDNRWDGNHWGGFINANGVNFVNNSRSIAFMKSNFEDLSEIKNCNFPNGNRAITNWASDGVNIENCHFGSIDPAIGGLQQFGVFSIDASMEVYNNTFEGLPEGIGMRNMLNIGDQYEIKNNIFNQNGNAIFSTISNSLEIMNNNFTTNTIGVSLMGESAATVQNNVFNENLLGVDLHSSGNSPALVSCNHFVDNTWGVNPSGNNFGLTYFNNENDFPDPNSTGRLNNTLGDIIIENDLDGNLGLISNQGNFLTPLLNTFSIGNNKRHFVALEGETQIFQYFGTYDGTNEVTLPQCFLQDTNCPNGNVNNFDMFSFIGATNFQCGNIGVIAPRPLNPKGELQSNFDQSELTSGQKEKLIREIKKVTITNDFSLVIPDKDLELQNLNIINGFVRNKNYAGLQEYLDEFDNYLIPLKYNVAVLQKDFAEASNYLEILINSPNWESYAFAQIHYLAWIQDPSYRPSKQDSISLTSFANLDSPNSGYAKTMASIFYDLNFQPQIPISENARRSVSSILPIGDNQILFPNPTEGLLNIVNKNLEFIDYSIYNISGKLLLSDNLLNIPSISINLDRWNNGIYIIKLKKSNGEFLTEKIILN